LYFVRDKKVVGVFVHFRAPLQKITFKRSGSWQKNVLGILLSSVLCGVVLYVVFIVQIVLAFIPVEPLFLSFFGLALCLDQPYDIRLCAYMGRRMFLTRVVTAV
jgi:hypothetical protein